jgi:hypothetical protein
MCCLLFGIMMLLVEKKFEVRNTAVVTINLETVATSSRHNNQKSIRKNTNFSAIDEQYRKREKKRNLR